MRTPQCRASRLSRLSRDRAETERDRAVCAGVISLKEIRGGGLLDALQHLDEEDDINKVLRFFSYEHFYVVYCKFWELDTDHDFMIDREDLLR